MFNDRNTSVLMLTSVRDTWHILVKCEQLLLDHEQNEIHTAKLVFAYFMFDSSKLIHMEIQVPKKGALTSLCSHRQVL